MRRPFLKSKAALNKERQSDLLQELAEEYRNDYGSVVNELKDLGDQWSTETAFSIGLDDIKPEKAARRAVLAKAEKNIAASGTKVNNGTLRLFKNLIRLPRRCTRNWMPYLKAIAP
jgi:RNA polymerase Rpb1, domain 3.